MSTLKTLLLLGTLTATAATPGMAQVHKYYTPGTVWTVTTIRVAGETVRDDEHGRTGR